MCFKNDEIICHCEQVTYEEIFKAINSGAVSVEELTDQTNAGLACGYCIEQLEQILKENL